MINIAGSQPSYGEPPAFSIPKNLVDPRGAEILQLKRVKGGELSRLSRLDDVNNRDFRRVCWTTDIVRDSWRCPWFLFPKVALGEASDGRSATTGHKRLPHWQG